MGYANEYVLFLRVQCLSALSFYLSFRYMIYYLNRFRAFVRSMFYDAGMMDFYGYHSRVFVLFRGHCFVGMSRVSHRLMIEFV